MFDRSRDRYPIPKRDGQILDCWHRTVATMAGPISHMFYTDDSGDLDVGWIVYGWLELAAADWDAVLKCWLTFRKKLVADYGVPTSQELHTTAFVKRARQNLVRSTSAFRP
jgi:hypothetical protein